MKLTLEQKNIVASSGNIKINAVAGSGKTSTLIEYARARSSAGRILYLAFNRSVRQEAQRRFEKAGVGNVDVQTAHSLAFRHVVSRNNYEVAAGYKAHEIVSLLKLEQVGRDPYSAFAVANHIARYSSLFCNQPARRVDEVDYTATVEDAAARTFVRHHHDRILQGTRRLLAKMDRAEIPVSHEFYLKKFQLSQPQLDYEYVLFDEGQDASPVMVDVFLRQGGTKVIVGDMHQQIYGWRHAVNALGSVDFTDHALTTSFRFDSSIAALAMECLAWKRHVSDYAPVTIVGAGKPAAAKTKATIARTNLFLLRSAISAISRRSGIKKLYFEGNLSSYTYAAEGASIYDVLNLFTGWQEGIRDPLIKTMAGFDDLKKYAGESEDLELNMLIDIVSEYGRSLPALLKELKDRHVADDKRHTADMVFSTVHRCKGMEYDSVTLESDFVNEQRILKMKSKGEEINADKLSEEINLAYVALTRTKDRLRVPKEMFPLHEEMHYTPATAARSKSAGAVAPDMMRFAKKPGKRKKRVWKSGGKSNKKNDWLFN